MKHFSIVCFLGFVFTAGVATNALSQVVKQKKAKPNQTLTRPAATLSRPTGEGVWQTFPQPGSFVMALARDGMDNLWVGTEGNGVWQYQGNVERRMTNAETGQKGAWRQFTTKDGLGDDYAYSVAVDKQGRIWVGHLNHGVSVYNGTSWRNYDVPCGPIGERVFKIAVCPTDGDVWIGTSAGLTRYEVGKDEWKQYTKNSGVRIQNPESGGLPANQISAIAFDKAGNIYVGTQCDGVAMASRDSDYTDWRQAPLADQVMPTFAGYGLPSRLINDLLVTSDGTIYAATDGGLVWSRDSGTTWTFRRGKDFADKMRGLAGGPPKVWSDKYIPKDVPPEDYVTCLAEDDAGVIWADFRQHGLLALSGYGYEELEKVSADKTGGADFGRAILPMPDFRPWLASYGKGLLRAAQPRRLLHKTVEKPELPDVVAEAPFPTPAHAPDLAELNGLLKEIESVPVARLTNGAVVPLADDWRTEGQWTGRYGRFWIALCANISPNDDLWGAGWDVMYDARMGLNHAPGDSLRYWIHWTATKDNRCLEMSPLYLHSRVLRKETTWDRDRRESEWDDHGETYPMSKDGPHVYCSLSIPAGLFYLSLYEIDPNGHDDNGNRFRDYEIFIRPYPGRASLDQQVGKTFIMRPPNDIAGFDQQPELAHARAHDFWGGVYKRFLVRGPTKLTIQVNRNYSMNTILPGVMLDLVDELPPPYYCTRQEWESKQPNGVETDVSAFVPADNAAAAAQWLETALKEMPSKNATWWAENKRRFYLPLLRWELAETDKNNSPALATSFYELNLFADWEKQLHQQGITTAREMEKALRWDGVAGPGMGNQMISAYVKAHPEIHH